MVNNQSTPAHRPAFCWGCWTDKQMVDAKLHKLFLTKSAKANGETTTIVIFNPSRFGSPVNRGTNVDSAGPRCFPVTVARNVAGPRLVR